MNKIKKGNFPKINLEDESNKPSSSFKVQLQKPSKIKSGLDAHVVGQHRAKKYNIARNHGIMGLKKSSSKNDKFQGV